MRQLYCHINRVSAAIRYGIDELADLGGVSRRTVRYYIQEGLLPTPYGVGRGDHYGPEHLEALLGIKALQEAGKTLEEIRQPAPARRAASVPPPATKPAIVDWRRVHLAPGVELHISSEQRLPTAVALRSLAEWCRAHLSRGRED